MRWLILSSGLFLVYSMSSFGVSKCDVRVAKADKPELTITRFNMHNFALEQQVIREAWEQVGFVRKSRSWELDDPISKLIGKGTNALVVRGESKRVYKVAKDVERTVKLQVEYLINQDLRKNFDRYGIHVDEIPSYDEAFIYLEKIPFKQKMIATSIFGEERAMKKRELSDAQRVSLKRVFQGARLYAEDSGFGLDIKGENLLWDEKLGEWILFDCGPRISYLPMGFTLDRKDFGDFLKEWLYDEPPVED